MPYQHPQITLLCLGGTLVSPISWVIRNCGLYLIYPIRYLETPQPVDLSYLLSVALVPLVADQRLQTFHADIYEANRLELEVPSLTQPSETVQGFVNVLSSLSLLHPSAVHQEDFDDLPSEWLGLRLCSCLSGTVEKLLTGHCSADQPWPQNCPAWLSLIRPGPLRPGRV